MTASTGPPSAVRRRTSSVDGRSRPSTSAIIPSVSVEPAAVRSPRRLEGGGAGSVATGDDGRIGPAGPSRNVPAVATANEAAEHGLAVEGGDAHPVDGAVRADQRGRAGVAQ